MSAEFNIFSFRQPERVPGDREGEVIDHNIYNYDDDFYSDDDDEFVIPHPMRYNPNPYYFRVRNREITRWAYQCRRHVSAVGRGEQSPLSSREVPFLVTLQLLPWCFRRFAQITEEEEGSLKDALSQLLEQKHKQQLGNVATHFRLNWKFVAFPSGDPGRGRFFSFLVDVFLPRYASELRILQLYHVPSKELEALLAAVAGGSGLLEQIDVAVGFGEDDDPRGAGSAIASVVRRNRGSLRKLKFVAYYPTHTSGGSSKSKAVADEALAATLRALLGEDDPPSESPQPMAAEGSEDGSSSCRLEYLILVGFDYAVSRCMPLLSRLVKGSRTLSHLAFGGVSLDKNSYRILADVIRSLPRLDCLSLDFLDIRGSVAVLADGAALIARAVECNPFIRDIQLDTRGSWRRDRKQERRFDAECRRIRSAALTNRNFVGVYEKIISHGLSSTESTNNDGGGDNQGGGNGNGPPGAEASPPPIPVGVWPFMLELVQAKPTLLYLILQKKLPDLISCVD